MICPNCGNNNRNGARFCDNCGMQLEIVCPNCENINRPEAKYCDNCGVKLTVDIDRTNPTGDSTGGLRSQSPSIGKQSSSLESIIPQEFATKLKSARQKRSMVGERRVVTILFCDVVDSTVAAAQLDPEEWTEVINAAFEYIIRPVYKYEGMVARMMGDGILAFFGAPIAHEDDPHRAVLAGLEIIEGINRYRDDVHEHWGINLNVRVGINTGMVVVGNVGTDLQMEYTAMGDAINVASRMETTALPGTVQITADTQRIVSSWFDFEDLGTVAVKGKDLPVHSYRVLGGKVEPLEHKAGHTSPLVGRDREIERIMLSLSDLQKGTGGVIGLFGDAGLGKTRLIHELKDTINLNGSDIQWYESTSLSYEIRQPYTLFQHLLRRAWGISPQDRGDRLGRKINNVLSGYKEDVKERIQPIIEIFFGLDEQQMRFSSIGEAYQHQLYQVIHDLIYDWTLNTMVVLVFDDLHWADPASTALLQYVFQLTDRSPLLVLFAMRTERDSPGWQVKQFAEKQYPHRYTEIQLDPLTDEHGRTLIDNLLSVSGMPEDVCRYVLQKSEGNPFFLEEITRSLLDSGAVTRQSTDNPNSPFIWQPDFGLETLNIPDNLYSLLAARIDRLGDHTRNVVQLAAVIGRTFYHRVLQSIYEPLEKLDSSLDELQRAEMIVEEARLPELEYSFKHSLTRETIYRTILRQQRREYHMRVGLALERLFPDQVDEYAPTLAHHFEQAGDERRAFSYHLLAGEAALRLYAIPQALERFNHALDILRQHDCYSDIVAQNDIARLYLRLGRTFELDGQFESALAIYEELENISRQCELRQELLDALISQALLRCTATSLFNHQSGEALLEQSMILARELSDRASEAKILWLELNLRRLVGDNTGAIQAGEKSLKIVRQLDLREQLPYTLHDLGYAYSAVGKNKRALSSFQEAQELWREHNNLPMLADNIAGMIFIYYDEGHFDAAIAASEEAYQISSGIHNLWGQSFSLMEVGLVYRDRGEYSQALEVMQESIDLGDKGNAPVSRSYVPPQIGLIYADLGLCDQGVAITKQSIDQKGAPLTETKQLANLAIVHNHLQCGDVHSAMNAIGPQELLDDIFADLGFSVVLVSVLVRLRLECGDLDGAMNLAQLLEDLYRKSGFFGFLPEVLYYKSLVHLAFQEEDVALQVLHDALQVAKSLGHRRLLWQILAALADLSPVEDASSFRAQARETLLFIANHTPEGVLRNSFLAQPKVSSLLEENNH
jgi:predicted ATPase/class 3 adenylate cyclase